MVRQELYSLVQEMKMRYFSTASIKSKWIAWVLGFSVSMHVLLIRFHYSTDTAIILLNGDLPLWHNHCGRPLTALVSWLLGLLNFNLAAYQIVSTLGALIILSICVHLISACSNIEEHPRKALMYAAAYLTIFNPFMEDAFLFPEFVIFTATSMFFTVLAVVSFVSKPNNIMAGISLFLLVIGVCFYQASISFFIPLSILFLSAQALNFLNFIKKSVLIFVVYFFAGLFIYLYTAYFSGIGFSSNRININILDRCQWLATYIVEKSVNNLGGYTTGIIFCSGCIALMAFLFWVLRQKDNKRRIQYLFLLNIIICLLILSLIPIIMSDYPGISLRSIAPLGGVVGIIMMFIILHRKSLPRSFYFGTGVIFILNFMVIILVDSDKIVSNAHDLMIAKRIIFKIHKYEETTGETVDKIALVEDKNPTLRYGDLKTRIYKYRIMSTDWAIPAFLSHLAKRDFKNITMPDSIYHAHFVDKDWNIFSEEQVCISNSTLYLAIY